jgi:hypothetical protein
MLVRGTKQRRRKDRFDRGGGLGTVRKLIGGF